MVLTFIFLLHLISAFVHSAVAGVENKQFNCPNNELPKKDEQTGISIQCLPGQASELVCGPNYSCFFSGFNYQCCPSVNDDEDEKIKPSNEEVECPRNALAVLDSNGVPLRCNGLGECSMSKLFCHGAIGNSICCENLAWNEEQSGQQDEEKRTIEPQIHADIPVNRTTLRPHQPKDVPITQKNIADNDLEVSGMLDKGPSIAENDSSKGIEKEDSKVQKQPQNVMTNGGSYAPPKNLDQLSDHQNSGEDKKIKQFIMDQIKQGWPYNEKYYRPGIENEDIFVLRNRGRPSAIIHFPN